MEFSIAGTMPVLINQIIAMFLMMTVGLALYKVGLLRDDGVAQLASIAIYVGMPAVMLRALIVDFEMDKLVNGAISAGLSALFTGLSLLVAWIVYRNRDRVAQFGVMVSNIGFIGIPLVDSAFGGECTFYISAAIITQCIIIWTYGVWLVSQDRSKVSIKAILTNPSVISVIVGVLLFVSPVDLPDAIDGAIDGLANINAGVALIVLGAYLAQTDMLEVLKSKDTYIANALRLLVCPILTAAALAFLPIDLSVKMALLVAFAAPIGQLTAMFSHLFGGNYTYGAGLVATSTLFSMATMPLVLWLGLLIM